jgi:DNA-binding MarR family transcriptional regulator/N-acetylglutamate synthase-like GNAT family acetyltransferase
MQQSSPVARVRSFNRFYTALIGVLERKLLHSPFSLTEARVLYELAHRDPSVATEIGADLGLDSGYLSRILRRFEQQGLILRRAASGDGRRQDVTLTEAGREAFAALDLRSSEDVAAMISALTAERQERLVKAMAEIEILLNPRARAEAFVIRDHRPGDVGWVVQRHGALYAEEYGWDSSFEAMVAEIAAKFLREFDPARERCWIAEREGERVGSVFLVRENADVARLRLLLVEPSVRGHGLGRRLVEECLRFARQTGYRRVTLWTNANLHAARRIYETCGFRLVAEEPHHSFGKDLVGQTWEKEL